jgi:hypothetical protein
MNGKRAWCAALVMACCIWGCSAKGRDGVQSTSRPLLTINGLMVNGLSTNGLIENGFWQNGFWQNGFWQNGFWQNGFWQNGFWQNGFWQNGFWQNGFWQNGFWQNGFWQNGLNGQPVPGDTLRQSAYARQLLQYIYSCAMPASTYDTTLDPNMAAPLLCAVDADCATGYSCRSDGKCVIPLQGGGANGSGFAVNDDGTTWWGAPAPGGATDLTTGKWGVCDESCQRWVSACVLARTNAYGVHVQISMRVPGSAPQGASLGRQRQFAAIEAAVAPTQSELNDYNTREGAYYGNIFATVPVAATAPADSVTPPTPVPYPGTDGSWTGPVASNPSYNACAGPDSNIPELTKRFCSSQGDNVVINVSGVCLTTATQQGTCDGMDTSPSHSIFSCYTSPGLRTLAESNNSGLVDPSQHYDEVVTVYLKQPIACCGNSVCESGEDPTNCASDCHPGTWAKDYPPAAQAPTSIGRDTNNVLGLTTVQTFALSSTDDSIVAVGMNYGAVDLVAGVGCPTPPPSQGLGVIAKYNLDGTTAWVSRFGPLPDSTGSGGSDRDWEVMAATVDSQKVTTVVGWELTPNHTLWVSRFDPCGVQTGSTLTFPQDATNTSLIPEVVTTDSAGNIVISGAYSGYATFGSTTIFSNTGGNPSSSPPLWDVFLLKMTPDGTVTSAAGLWLADFNPVAARSLSVDPHDNLVVLAGNGPRANSPTPTPPEGFTNLGNIYRLCPDGTWGTCADGTTAPPPYGICADHSTPHCPDGSKGFRKGFGDEDCFYTQYFAASADADGNVYATGWVNTLTTINQAAIIDQTTNNNPPLVVKYGPDGAFQWENWANVQCAQGGNCEPPYMCWDPSKPNALDQQPIAGVAIGFDDAHNVIVANFGDPAVGGNITFGTSPAVNDYMDFSANKLPPFPSYGAANVFITAYSPDGNLQWAKQIPMILSPNIQRMLVTGGGRVVMNGGFGGSMEADGILLQTADTTDPSVVDSFLASFAAPPADTQVPDLGICTDLADPTNIVSLTKPADIYVQATSPDGAEVFYMLPTAVDSGNAGVSVYCAPRPNTVFHLGQTIVTCTASDPRGNQETQTFKVTVVDTVGPVFDPSGDETLVAPTPAGVPFSPPQAIDQIDRVDPNGFEAVSCTVAPGNMLQVGKTTITCSASDHSGNQSQETFTVTVVLASGAPCSSADQCATDACVDGVCCKTMANAASCGQCQACNLTGSLGTCAPTTGGSCDDHDACTQTDTCQGGVCTGSNPVSCSASDQCHLAGTCDHATGACSNPPAPDGTSCDDHSVCTTGDVCTAGVCGGAAVSCDDQNPCTVDSCDAAGGCAHTPGNPGQVCRAADNSCDSPETCTGTSATCPPDKDMQAPTLNPGTNQVIVGRCSSAPIIFAEPSLANSSCETGTTVSCSWVSGTGHGTCARTGLGTSLPGNSYGPHTVTCTATDTSGNVSPSVSFTVTVLEPLTVAVQPPLYGDNDSIDNVVKDGSTVPTKVKLYKCGADVTSQAPVIVKLGVTYQLSGGSSVTKSAVTSSGPSDTGGVMTLEGAYYHYNLSTKGDSVTVAGPAFYQVNITAAYTAYPGVVVGSDAIQIDTK